jgi:membrane protease YdiL (CAAX protease family)
LKRSILGVLVAIIVTTAMDATGLSDFSALPLCPLMFLFWYLDRLSRRSMGFVWGRLRHYGLAMLYPVAMLGAVGLVSAAAGATDFAQANWEKASRDLVLIAASTILVAIVTEEGFFRGWLFASLDRAGETPSGILLWSSVAFALWHLSAVSLHTGFDLPVAQIPVFIVNAAVMGAIWGLLRSISGSVIVAIGEPWPLERSRLRALRLWHQDRRARRQAHCDLRPRSRNPWARAQCLFWGAALAVVEHSEARGRGRLRRTVRQCEGVKCPMGQ